MTILANIINRQARISRSQRSHRRFHFQAPAQYSPTLPSVSRIRHAHPFEVELISKEAILFPPAYAWTDQNRDMIQLKPPWTKGSRPRTVPVRTPTQIETLHRVSSFCGSGSLIPAGLKFSQQRGRYEYQARQAGLSALHGLCHTCAQQRYIEMTDRRRFKRAAPYLKGNLIICTKSIEDILNRGLGFA